MNTLVLVRSAAVCGLVTLAAHANVMAQSRWTAGTGVRYETYSFGSPEAFDLRRVSLFTVPFAFDTPLLRQLDLRVASAYARGEVERGSRSESSVSGMTDTEVRLTLGLSGERLRLSGVAMVPTGKQELTAAEMDVAGVIASDLLPFAISNWGTGGGFGVSAAAATPLGESTAIALSGGFVVAREYEPIADESFAYRPGSQMHVRAAIDQNVGGAGKASLQLTFQHFAADQNAGSNLYQTGDRLQVVGSYAFSFGPVGSAVAYGGYLHRGSGEYTRVVRVTSAQDLFYGGLGFRLPVGSLVFLPTADIRLLGTATDVDQGYTMSIGTGAEIPVGAARLVPHVRGRFGSLSARDGGSRAFTGMDLGMSLRAGGVR
jgi:hypothetical protein